MEKEFIVEAKTGSVFEARGGESIIIIDLEGKQVVDFFAVRSDNFEEFLSTGVTIDVNESLRLKKGDGIYTNLYSKMFTLAEDDVQEHDLLHPCCRTEMYDSFYKNGNGHSNCFDNINNKLIKKGVSLFGIIQPVNFFMNTRINQDGSIIVDTPVSKAGDKVELIAEMDVIVGLAACSVEESQCNGGKCSSVKVIIK